MTNYSAERIFDTPVVLIIFNRPKETAKTLEAISRVKPKKLYVISDGPRSSSKSDKENIGLCRGLIESINWECEILKKYSEINLGCRKNVVDGLTWVFSIEESAIILEDDCVPNDDFFLFCSDLLKLYDSSDEIGSICGTHFELDGLMENSCSYFFSNFPQVWGWATWRRVWEHYESDLSKWTSQSRLELINKTSLNPKVRRYWKHKFDSVAKAKVDTWDFQLVYLHWRLNLKTIIPARNLIQNIGFGPTATHTIDQSNPFSNLKHAQIKFPLIHPKNIVVNENYDSAIEDMVQSKSTFILLLENTYTKFPKSLKKIVRIIYLRFKGRGQ